MKTTTQYLICCDYGEFDAARSIPILVVPTTALAANVCRDIDTDPHGYYRRLVLKALGERFLPPDADFSVREISSLVEEKLLTKNELRQQLLDGETIGDLFETSPGQDCEIFKASEFLPGDEILYIPDFALNNIPADRPVCDSAEELEDVLSQCHSGRDFVEECGGDVEKAERLFWYCDWQHPSSALPELDGDD